MKKYVQNRKGFTLIELLIAVIIVGILSSIALPNYTRSVEKARATEAMNIIKAANDAVYAYAAERTKCPESFSKILVSIPGTQSATVVTGKHFKYYLNKATLSPIPGTSCGGIVAEREGGSASYKIWNPYQTTAAGKRTLACTGTGKGIGVCKALGLYDATKQPY